MNKYQTIKKIGVGAYGDVFKVKNIGDNKEYALKKVEISDFDEFNELDLLSRLNHPHLLGLEEFYFTNQGGNYLLNYILPLANMDLMSYIQRVKPSLDEKISLMYKIASGVSFMHLQGYYHCDLKASNILMFDNEPKIADYGLSCVSSYDRDFSGTPFITSPQGLEKYHIKDSKYVSVYKERLDFLQTDLFCLGTTFFTILSEGDNIFTKEYDCDIIGEKYDYFIKNFGDIFQFQLSRMRSLHYIKAFKSNKDLVSDDKILKMYQKVEDVLSLIKAMMIPSQQDRLKNISEVMNHSVFKNEEKIIEGELKQETITHQLDETFLDFVTSNMFNNLVKIDEVYFDSKTTSIAYSLYLRSSDLLESYLKLHSPITLIKSCFYLASTVTKGNVTLRQLNYFNVNKDKCKRIITKILKHTGGKLRFKNEVVFDF